MQNPPSYRNDTVLPLPLEVRADAWAVDAACSGNPGPMEYQAIDLQTGYRVFHFGPVKGTNNIGEFLAIVHALALMQQKGLYDKAVSASARPSWSVLLRRSSCIRLFSVPNVGYRPIHGVTPLSSGRRRSGVRCQLTSGVNKLFRIDIEAVAIVGLMAS